MTLKPGIPVATVSGVPSSQLQVTVSQSWMVSCHRDALKRTSSLREHSPLAVEQ